MNNGEVFNIPNDEPLDLDDIAKARWMKVNIPIVLDKTKIAYLNIAQINRIEVIEGDE
jgi:hypothetical protein